MSPPGKHTTYFTSRSRVLTISSMEGPLAAGLAALTSVAAYLMAYSLAMRRGLLWGLAIALGGLAVFAVEALAFELLWGRGYRFVSARRIATAYSFTNVAWMIALVPAAVLGKPSLVLYSVFPFWAVRAYIIGAVFSPRTPRAVSATLSTALAPLYNVAVDVQMMGLGSVVPMAFGFPLVAVAGASLAFLERGRVGGLEMLSAFLEAWSGSKGDLMESLMSELGEDGFARGYLLGSSKFVVAVPYVHPGPFRPVGSFDVPGRLSEGLRARSCAIVLHGAVDHGRNLASRHYARKYVAFMSSAASSNGFARAPLSPVVTVEGSRVRLHGIWIGASALLLVIEPVGGLEDYGDAVVERIEELGSRHGVKVIAVDAHNSLGPDPGEEDVAELLSLAEEILRRGPPGGRIVRCGCSARPGAIWPAIGSAGVSVLAMEDDSGSRTALVSVDSNNAAPGFREAVAGELARVGFDRCILCTTDTHETTGISRAERGYAALGEGGDGVLGRIVEAARAALADMSPCDGVGLKELSMRARFAGESFLRASRETTSRSIRVAKAALIAALALAAVGYVSVALL
ncbi:MAG: DUF2070 family protein [Conexivisphaera sp.]